MSRLLPTGGGILLKSIDSLLAVAARALARLAYRRELDRTCTQLLAARESVRALATTEQWLPLVDALVIAEDRRFYEHKGLDIKGVARAAVVYARHRQIQGASTITQQLVRVTTGDRRRSISRKLKELCLACSIDLKFAKAEQAELYLANGYYGWRMNGLRQAMYRLEFQFPLSQREAAELVARLRYPEPSDASSAQGDRITKRACYIRSELTRQKDRDVKAP